MKSSKSKLNVLPPNPEMGTGRFPSWLHRSVPKGGNLWKTGQILSEKRLHTVCEEARCPNLPECWSKKTATFLTMGKECTRSCGFCSIAFSKQPKPLDPEEPKRIAESVESLGLRHVVLTQVARDDLPDGGAAHLAKIIAEIRTLKFKPTIEILTSDFEGNEKALEIVLEAKPEIFNYNIETVRKLTPRVRHKATYDRTLELLNFIKTNRQNEKMLVKSGLMVGLGETEEEVFTALVDLKTAGCDILTIGQYLQSDPKKLLVKEFIHPRQFKKYAEYGKGIGIPYIYAGPFVRSSYNAEQVFNDLKKL